VRSNGDQQTAMLKGFSKVIAASLLGLAALSAQAQSYLMYVGTYTDHTASKGIYAFSYDANAGRFDPLGLAAETKDPSFLAASSDGRFLYAVNELSDFEGKKSGAVSAFRVDPGTGKLAFLNQVASRGADPCYIAFDKSGRYLLVANYSGGNVAALPVDPDGRLREAAGFVQHSGSGANKERQEGPHAHWIETSPDNRFALAADLGLDELIVYHFEPNSGELAANGYGKVNAGSGPRHAAFSRNGKFIYLLNEMKGTVTVFRFDKGKLNEVQSIESLPRDFSGSNDAAELVMHPSGRFLYASNRGEDAIVVFRVDQKKGTLQVVERSSTQGKTPRSFAIDPDGKLLLAANQNSNNIVVFRIDASTGHLTPTGQKLDAPAPVCVVFVKRKTN